MQKTRDVYTVTVGPAVVDVVVVAVDVVVVVMLRFCCSTACRAAGMRTYVVVVVAVFTSVAVRVYGTLARLVKRDIQG